MFEQLKVSYVKCVDDSEGTRGVSIGCEPDGTWVTLLFDKSITHKQTDDLEALLRAMKLKEVTVELLVKNRGPAFH
jgi:hypothetical protein